MKVSGENPWEDILSRNPEKIKTAYGNLSEEEQKDVSSHLKKMSTESGWHKEQKISADTALEVILNINKQGLINHLS